MHTTADEVEPTTPEVDSVNVLAETNLVPLTAAAAPGPAVSAELSDGAVTAMNFDIALTNGLFTVNDVAFVSPSVPVLLQILSGVSSAAAVLPSGSVYALPANSVIEINIPGGSAGAPVCALSEFAFDTTNITFHSLASHPPSRTCFLCD